MRSVRPIYVVTVTMFAVALAFVAGSAAQGQTPTTVCVPDGYGCLSTTTLAPGQIPTPECQISVTSAVVGGRVDVTITDVPVGSTINLSLGGQVVASGTAVASSAFGVPLVAGEYAAGVPSAGFADVPLSFTVPALAAGSYTLVATGPAFTCECLQATGFSVLAAEINRGGTGDGNGSLARTGFTVLGFLVVAALLIVGGRRLLSTSRRSA